MFVAINSFPAKYRFGLSLQQANIVIDGNSLAFGHGVQVSENLATQLGLDLNGIGYNVTITNIAVGGQTNEDMYDIDTQLPPLYVSGRQNILIVWEYRNYLSQNRDAQGVLDSVATMSNYCNQVRNINGQDWVIVVLPVIATWISATDQAGYEAFDLLRQDLNLKIEQGYRSYADIMIPVHKLEQFNDLNDNTFEGYIYSTSFPDANTYYSDGVHLTPYSYEFPISDFIASELIYHANDRIAA